ncbi:MAG TPA: radical SAM family heme chaperone HemW [Marmoricola sp.]|nr:radical SAM family heme chaperone HemW [Marmoricola sp.]
MPPRLGIYVHVPFCSVRCGYCDFNTYTATELGGGGAISQFADQAIAEIALAARRLGPRPVDTVFFGGGTPTMLPPADLIRILAAIEQHLGLRTDAEVTTEANPDSVNSVGLEQLRAGGFNRISFGMQSAIPHVLQVLERTHAPERVPVAVAWARAAGFEQVSLDLIYGTAGESHQDWQDSLQAALSCTPDHVSAYSLIVESGTRLARQVRKGLVAPPDDDDLAEKYLIADDLLSAAGFSWYEISNWARGSAARCRHNELYWRSEDWWGVGPGAHSHLAGERWWNLKHPSAYAASLAGGQQPVAGRETLDQQMKTMEQVMLGIRLREGLGTASLDQARVNDLLARGLLEVSATKPHRVVLTRTGRLLGDAVARELV